MKKSIFIVTCIVALTAFTAFFTSSYRVKGADFQPRGAISICFDDGRKNQFDYAFQLMETMGMTGTYYIPTARIRDFSGNSAYMSVEEIQTLQTHGNEIGSHGQTHTNFLTLSNSTIRQECYASKQILQSFGLTVNNIAYPFGGTNPTVDAIASEYYRSGRYAYTKNFVMNPPISKFALFARAGEAGDNSTLMRLKSMVDQVYSANGWGVVFFHNVIPDVYDRNYTISTQDFSAFLNYVFSKGVLTITVNQALDLSSPPRALPLMTTTDHGAISPSSRYYLSGQALQLTATPPQSGPNERYVWLGWTGTGSGSYTGYDNPASITMNDPITQTASWAHQYKISLALSGVGSDYSGISAMVDGSSRSNGEWFWWDSGSSHSFSFQSQLNVDSVKRYVWQSSSGLSTQQSDTIVISGPGTLSAAYKIQFFVNASSPYGVAIGSGWYDSGENASIMAEEPIVYETPSIRHLFKGWNGDKSGNTSISDSITVNGPKLALASWKNQFLVVFNQSGLPEGFNANVVISAKKYNLPFSEWVDEEAALHFNFPSQLPDGFWTQYILDTSSSQSYVEVDSPKTITAQYRMQYKIEPFAMFAISAALTVSVGAALFMKRKL